MSARWRGPTIHGEIIVDVQLANTGLSIKDSHLRHGLLHATKFTIAFKIVWPDTVSLKQLDKSAWYVAWDTFSGLSWTKENPPGAVGSTAHTAMVARE
jgi:hypothetical protein